MNSMEILPEEDCQEQCGTIYLTSSGILVIHCTLCENRYNGYDEYAAHIEDHIAPDFFAKDFVNDMVDNDDGEVISTDQMYENSSSCTAKGDNNEYILEEGEDIFEVEFDRASQVLNVADELNSNTDDFIEVERLDTEGYTEVSEEGECETKPNLLNVKAFSDSPTISKKPKVQRQADSNSRKRTHKCPHCEFSCNDRSNLLGHIKRHSNNKPHKCTECGKAFYTRTELKAHTRSHTGERPYLCTECGQAFGTSSKLSLHLKRHANIRDKECPMCDMKFFSTTRLRDHMSIHSDDRPLKCDLCEASFKAYSSLRNHRKLHENKRKYKCPLCSASFNQNPGLYSHMKKRHSVVKNAETTDKEIKAETDES